MTDSCPECVEPGVQPISEQRAGDEITHSYRCPACRHEWKTSRYLPVYSEIHQQAAEARRRAAA